MIIFKARMIVALFLNNYGINEHFVFIKAEAVDSLEVDKLHDEFLICKFTLHADLIKYVNWQTKMHSCN